MIVTGSSMAAGRARTVFGPLQALARSHPYHRNGVVAADSPAVDMGAADTEVADTGAADTAAEAAAGAEITSCLLGAGSRLWMLMKAWLFLCRGGASNVREADSRLDLA